MSDDIENLEAQIEALQAEMNAINQQELRYLPEPIQQVLSAIDDPLQLQDEINKYRSLIPYRHDQTDLRTIAKNNGYLPESEDQ